MTLYVNIYVYPRIWEKPGEDDSEVAAICWRKFQFANRDLLARVLHTARHTIVVVVVSLSPCLTCIVW